MSMEVSSEPLGLDRKAQTSDGGHVQIHKQRWCWSPRFHKDYKLSILSVNDKYTISFLYSMFLLRDQRQNISSPFHQKIQGRGKYFPALG